MGDTDLAALGRLLADSSRATMCTVMLDGRFHTAGELARAAEVAPSTASEHLTRLVSGGLVEGDRQGRHRYYRLAGADVAAALESLALVAPERAVTGLRSSSASAALRRGRTCYDHLAGELGVRLTDALIRRNVITDEFALADAAPLRELGVAVPAPADGASRRPLVRGCVDWTERRHHAAGVVPAALATRLFDLGWVARVGSGRAVRLTGAGEAGLVGALGSL
ncbi:ArsR/SmtB family transcription factor [Ornithinicoccus halotolerans]|uniref:ArsR/SmtB family transcription factor n=1 Tax=Ornithinicoccus halotolerans TaxID=1748220 RepID=UPI001E3D11A7|nr:winged helix-turn-helix domain-containing protein [Ornithinicoccus halotolerans]